MCNSNRWPNKRLSNKLCNRQCNDNTRNPVKIIELCRRNRWIKCGVWASSLLWDKHLNSFSDNQILILRKLNNSKWPNRRLSNKLCNNKGKAVCQILHSLMGNK